MDENKKFIPLDMFVDTGATISVIKLGLVKPRNMENCRVEVTYANGSKGMITKAFITDLAINNAVVPIKLYEYEKHDCDILVGKNFLHAFSMYAGRGKIADADKYKTTFVIPHGQYQWKVMPFGLKNAPSEFQRYIDSVFRKFRKFVVPYIDDVLIFSNSLKEHLEHLRIIYREIEKSGFVISEKKLEMFEQKVNFLGVIIHLGKIVLLQEQVIQTILNFLEAFNNVEEAWDSGWRPLLHHQDHSVLGYEGTRIQS